MGRIGEGTAMAARWIRTGWAAPAALLVLAAAVRLALAALGWPETNSDEATMGLAALHIARDGAHPAYFYGQDYMGTLEAYLAAAAFRVLGVSTFALRLGVVACSTAGLAVLYLLTATLYDRRVALGGLGLLTLGSQPMLYNQIIAVGGHAETLLFGALCPLLAARLAQRPHRQPGALPWSRRAAFAAWGASAGLGLWSHLLVAPFVAASALLLAGFCGRELAGRALPWLLGGLLLGAAPMLAHDLGAAPGHRSPEAVLHVRGRGGQPGPAAAAWRRRLGGTFLVSLPRWSGATVACRVLPGPRAGTVRRPWPPPACAAASAGASAGLLALGVGSAVQALRPAAGDHGRARRAGRLGLLGAAGLTLALYVTSPAPAVTPETSIRYLFGLLVAAPAALAPLLAGAATPAPVAPP